MKTAGFMELFGFVKINIAQRKVNVNKYLL